MIQTSRVTSSILLATLCLLREASCGYEWGPCPKLSLKSPFSPAQLAGSWYEHARDKSLWYIQGDCIKSKFTLLPDNTLEIRNSQRKPGSNEGAEIPWVGNV